MHRLTSLPYNVYLIPHMASKLWNTIRYQTQKNNIINLVREIEIRDVFWKLPNLSKVFHLKNFFSIKDHTLFFFLPKNHYIIYSLYFFKLKKK